MVLYFNDVREGGETVFIHAPGIDHHDVPDTKVPVGEVSALQGFPTRMPCVWCLPLSTAVFWTTV